MYPGRQAYAASENLPNSEIALFRTDVWSGDLQKFLSTYWVYGNWSPAQSLLVQKVFMSLQFFVQKSCGFYFGWFERVFLFVLF